MNAVERWRELLPGWGVPEEILAQAPESPWGYPPDLMRRRAHTAAALEPSLSTRRAFEALPEGGSVLDVGVGGGAASLPLATRAARLTGVDESESMLDAFRQAAPPSDIRTVLGRWPDVADDVEPADVAVCHHVLYNVQDLEPFVRSLDAHARRRVVIEITDRHPLAWMSDLWLRFHDLRRPEGPTSVDAAEAISELGYPVRHEVEVRRPRSSGFERREDAVSLARRRLCLAPERDPEVAEALGDRLIQQDGLWSAGPPEQAVATLWWDRSS
ncbi:MAG TPA: methyltransferase domain-containing protein [Actinomycetota bacterium]|nr:methyltransferase domain-containing protein [Actinomycetota bacterium]